MHKRLLVITLMALLAFVFVSPAAAITHGQPDAGRHPHVGLLVFEVDGVPSWRCSGTLLTPTVVLTAGHCTDGATAARIWMDEIVQGNPEYPLGGATSYEGTPYTNPDFCLGYSCGNGLPGFAIRDVGIVVLSEPVPTSVVDEYGQLPTAGLVDALENKTPLDIVGYGAQEKIHGGPPDWTGPLVRMYAPTELVSGNFTHSDEFIRVAMNPGGGSGGYCFGDSGGPNLLRNSTTVIAVTSYGPSLNCDGVGYSSRLDLPDVLEWIESFL